MQISIAIPPSPYLPANRSRSPKYVSPGTRSAVVDVTAASGPAVRTVVTCGATACAGAVPAPIGTDTFGIGLNDAADGTGKTLSSGTTTATVVEGATNTLSVTFNGVVASLRVFLDNPNPPVNTTTTVTVNVTALDAAGFTIIGPEVYDHPVVVSDGDTSGATTMRTTTLNGPGDPAPTLTYNGAWIGGDSATAPITATVPANMAVKPYTAALAPVPQVIEYTIPTSGSQPEDLVKGPDGNVWFTENAGKIGRVTTSGAFTEFAVPHAQNAQANPWGITVGPDGNLWFTDQSYLNEAIDSITTSGVVTRHSVANGNVFRTLYTIVTGPDNNLWTADSNENKIVRFTTAGVETDYTLPGQLSAPQAITPGPDGALWFTESNGSRVGRIQTNGAITEYTYTIAAPSFLSTRPYGITTGPDGALWFTDPDQKEIGRMTTGGAGAEFARSALPNNRAIITGPDGAVWFNATGSNLGRISTKGTIVAFPINLWNANSGTATAFTIGPDGNIWFIDNTNNAIGKIVL